MIQVAARGVSTAQGRVKGARRLKRAADRRRGPDALSRAEARLSIKRGQGGFAGRRQAANRVLNAPKRLAAQRRLRTRQLAVRQRQLAAAQRRYSTAKAVARERARSSARSRAETAHKKGASQRRKAAAIRRGNAQIRRLLR
jgi:hypothetical protein